MGIFIKLNATKFGGVFTFIEFTGCTPYQIRLLIFFLLIPNLALFFRKTLRFYCIKKGFQRLNLLKPLSVLWSHQDLNLGPPDYESGAANQLSYRTKTFYRQTDDESGLQM